MNRRRHQIQRGPTNRRQPPTRARRKTRKPEPVACNSLRRSASVLLERRNKLSRTDWPGKPNRKRRKDSLGKNKIRSEKKKKE